MKNQKHYTKPVDQVLKSDCETLLRLALQEDAPNGDPTSESIFDASQKCHAQIVARESGIMCGLALIPHLLEIYQEIHHHAPDFRAQVKDGDRFQERDLLGEFRGSIRDILRLERIVLNFLQYLSGIATTVQSVVEKSAPNVRILDTRKTLPGYRRLAKYAVYCGGGCNHRIHLSDMAMIKDNHIQAAGSIGNAVALIRQTHPDLPLNVEVDRLDQLKEVLGLSVDIILLDNMRGETLREAVAMIQSHKTRPVLIELSGNWKPAELAQLHDLGDVGVSMGFLTHTTRFLDLGLDIVS